MYYGEEVPPGVVIDTEVVAASQQPGGDPVKFRRGKQRKRRPRRIWTTSVGRSTTSTSRSNPDNFWWWIQAVLVDPNELVVEDDESGQLYKISFSSDDDGAISFGEPEPVKIDYIPDTREAKKAAASHVAATLAIGRKVDASWAKREDSVLPTTTASGGAMDPKQIRERLGLAEDASDAEVQESLAELNEATGFTPGDGSGGSTVVPGTTVTPAGTGVPTPEGARHPGRRHGRRRPGQRCDRIARHAASEGHGPDRRGHARDTEGRCLGGHRDQDRDGEAASSDARLCRNLDGRIAPARAGALAVGARDGRQGRRQGHLCRARVDAEGAHPVELREIGHGGGGPEGTNASVTSRRCARGPVLCSPKSVSSHRRDAAAAAGENLGRQRISADASYRR
jgi:hypothetical protein